VFPSTSEFGDGNDKVTITVRRDARVFIAEFGRGKSERFQVPTVLQSLGIQGGLLDIEGIRLSQWTGIGMAGRIHLQGVPNEAKRGNIKNEHLYSWICGPPDLTEKGG
jgi:hypothetical protein